LVVWLFGDLNINAALGVNIAPKLTSGWLYPRIVCGGLWGFLFLLPVHRSSLLARGVLFSLGSSLVMLFVVLPIKAKKGMLGLDLWTLTPVLVLLFNAVWGGNHRLVARAEQVGEGTQQLSSAGCRFMVAS
jgi:hypothetical protein